MALTAGERADAPPGTGLRYALVTAAVVVFAYAPVLKSLFRQWLDDPNYHHGLLVPVISALLVYQRRSALKAALPGGDAVRGGALVIASGALLVAGTGASELFTARVSLPLLLFGLSFLMFGRRFTGIIAFPLAFLFLMIPLPYIVYYKIAFPLQLLGAKLSAAVLDLAGLNVIRQGNVLHFPNYSLEVVAACSGVRSLMTMVTLALVIGVVGDISVRKRVLLVAFAVPAAVAANALRLVVTGFGASLVSASFADGFLHRFSGVLVFASGLAVLLAAYFIMRRMR